MIKPRNSLVVLRVLDKKEQQVGNIVVPDGEELYTEGEVLAVGPGTISAEGGRTETFDLKPGQRVMVKYKAKQGPMNVLCGVKYVHDGEILYIFEQGSIVGVIGEPGEHQASAPQRKESKILQA